MIEKYKLPMHIVAALGSGRTELLAIGPMPDEATVRELLRLLADLIEDKRKDKEKFELLAQVVHEAARSTYGQAQKLEATVAAYLAIETRDEMAEALRRKDREE